MNPVKLHRAIRLAQTSNRRFRTLRLTIRDWSVPAAVCRAQQVPYDGDPRATGEGFVHLWREHPARRRIETRLWTGVADGPRWWMVDRASQSISSSHESADDSASLVDAFDHFPDAGWLTRRGVEHVGSTGVAGRGGIELELDPARASVGFCLLPGSDRYRLVLDVERGILLRAECFFESDLIAVEEAVEVAFDEELPGHLFEEPRSAPAGRRAGRQELTP